MTPVAARRWVATGLRRVRRRNVKPDTRDLRFGVRSVMLRFLMRFRIRKIGIRPKQWTCVRSPARRTGTGTLRVEVSGFIRLNSE